jgi:hypothetical protein
VNNNPELELFVEIAKLIKKYGPETFESLSGKLSSPGYTERLVAILSTTARIARMARVNAPETTKHQKFPRDFRSSLVALEKTDKEKSGLLIEFYDDLMAKTFLPTLKDIQAFVADHGLPPAKATARDKAIIPLFKALLPLPLDELKRRLLTLKSVSNKDDRSLEGWSNIILNKSHRIKKGD